MPESESLSIVEYRPEHEKGMLEFWKEVRPDYWTEECRQWKAWLDVRSKNFIVSDSQSVLGNATMIGQPIMLDQDTRVDFNWITDFYVSPKLIGKGMGKKLTQKLEDACEHLGTFGQSESARKCFSRLGWEGPDWLDLVITPLLLRRIKAHQSFEFTKTNFDDPSIQEVWDNRGAHRYPLGVRDQEFMKMRFANRPLVPYDIFLAQKNGEAKGWIVLRKIKGEKNRMFGRIPVALIADIFAINDDTEVLEFLLQSAMLEMKRQGLFFMVGVNTAGNLTTIYSRNRFSSELKIFGLPLKKIPAKGFMLCTKNGHAYQKPFYLTFLDCDAELTF